MSFESIPNLLADIIAEQQRTTNAVVQLAEALAGNRNTPKKNVQPAVATNTGSSGSVHTPACGPVPVAVVTIHPTATDAPTTVQSEAAAPLTYADIQPTLGLLMTAEGKGTPAVKALLTEFGVKLGKDLAPHQLADALARAQAVLNG